MYASRSIALLMGTILCGVYIIITCMYTILVLFTTKCMLDVGVCASYSVRGYNDNNIIIIMLHYRRSMCVYVESV